MTTGSYTLTFYRSMPEIAYVAFLQQQLDRTVAAAFKPEFRYASSPENIYKHVFNFLTVLVRVNRGHRTGGKAAFNLLTRNILPLIEQFEANATMGTFDELIRLEEEVALIDVYVDDIMENLIPKKEFSYTLTGRPAPVSLVEKGTTSRRRAFAFNESIPVVLAEPEIPALVGKDAAPVQDFEKLLALKTENVHLVLAELQTISLTVEDEYLIEQVQGVYLTNISSALKRLKNASETTKLEANEEFLKQLTLIEIRLDKILEDYHETHLFDVRIQTEFLTQKLGKGMTIVTSNGGYHS